MRGFIAIAILLILAGVGCLLHSTSFPVYSDASAPERLSDELESLPRETRFREWYSRLQSFETPHKQFSDAGRGLCAAGVGLLAAVALWRLYYRSPRMRSIAVILALWCGLWLGRIPFTLWYYRLRLKRFDYPVWGDSIAIPVFSESIGWIVGAVVSSVILCLLAIRCPLPTTIQINRPISLYVWLRGAFIVLWLIVLGICVAEGIADGDEGVVIASTTASVILLAFLSASEVPHPPAELTPLECSSKLTS